MPITPDVIQWHVDAIIDLPPGAVHLASSPVCDNQAFRLGRLAWGIQFHIETTPAAAAQWADEDADALADYDVEAILARADGGRRRRGRGLAPVRASGSPRSSLDPASVKAARPMRISTADPITDPAEIRAALAAELQASRRADRRDQPSAAAVADASNRRRA